MGTSTLAFASQVTTITSWPIDWVILVVLIALLTLESFRSGPARTYALSIALPLSLLAMNWFPTTIGASFVQTFLTTPIAQCLLFLLLAIIFFILLYRLFFSSIFPTGSVMQALLSALAAGFTLIVVWLQIPALDSLWHFSPQIQTIFGETYRLLWLFLSFLILAFAAG